MTTNTEFLRKFNQTADAAEKLTRLQQELGEMFKERYGQHYSDVDCDPVIDTVDVNGGRMTLAEIDESMAMCGCPKL